MFRRILIAESERAFVFVDGAFERVLSPGRHWIVRPFANVEVRRASLLSPRLTFPDVELVAAHPAALEHVDAFRVGDRERGLVFQRGNFSGFLGSGFHAFLKVPHAPITVEVVDIAGLDVVHPQRDVLIRGLGTTNVIRVFDVPEGHKAALFVDGARARILEPGRHAFWTGLHELTFASVDLREQAAEVQGQELMTQDKVSLRVNLSARFRVVDLAKALDASVSFRDAFHRVLQLALRDEVGARTLDALLADKEAVRAAIVARSAPQAAELGLVLVDAGLRDVILPGEMRTIFNQVIEAEKRAAANAIARREETAATRSLLNTAKLLEGNPVLMRLKELETMTVLAEKVGTFEVTGGLRGLMKALESGVRLGEEVK